MDGRQDVPAQSQPAPELGSDILHREQCPDRDRRRELFSQRRRAADAGQEGSAAARPAVFQAHAALTTASKTVSFQSEPFIPERSITGAQVSISDFTRSRNSSAESSSGVTPCTRSRSRVSG